MPSLQLFATTPRGMDKLLARELEELGVRRPKTSPGGVAFRGDLKLAYLACLWARTASRVLLRLSRFRADTPEELYAGVRSTIWSQHVAPTGTLAVDFHTSASRITHSRYGAQKVKDAVVDQLREEFGVRPSVDLRHPDLRINVYLHRDVASLSLDLAGESLHRRGYRKEGVPAPLKENLAAAILLLADWPALAREGTPLLDPMCGSGTLLVEAALMAADTAPGLLRDYYGFLGWRGHDPKLWTALLDEARRRRKRGLERIPAIFGYDAAPGAVRAAQANVRRAGLERLIGIEQRDLSEAVPPSPGMGIGLVVVNPPYGERLGDEHKLLPLYRTLGQTLKDRFPGWRAAVFSANPHLRQAIGLPSKRSHVLYNGPLACRLQLLDTDSSAPALPGEKGPSSGAGMLANRLRKNLRHLQRWARRAGVTCYRIYDADLPEYALAIDFYQDEQSWAHVQEYQAPASIPPARAQARLREALPVISEVLGIPPAQVFLKVHRRQRGRDQYEKLARKGEFHAVREGGCRFLVNFTDYLDTGLFLDHRLTRDMLQGMADGGRFLNLFGYTGTASVYAALGGALSTTTVDMSATYLDWARRNFELNRLDPDRHQLVRADCLDWLAQPAVQQSARYQLIFLDPPTFSNSKRMEEAFDLQRDHPWLVRQTTRLLAPDGVLVFSTNRRRFKLAGEALTGLVVEDITRATIPPDFARNPKVHRCWRIRPGAGSAPATD